MTAFARCFATLAFMSFSNVSHAFLIDFLPSLKEMKHSGYLNNKENFWPCYQINRLNKVSQSVPISFEILCNCTDFAGIFFWSFSLFLSSRK